MSLPITPAELQHADVLRRQQREWKIERAGWVVMALLLAAAIAGGFGGGPLAHASLASGSASLKFDRLVRHSVLTELRLELGPAYAINDRVRVSLDWKYLGSVNLREVTPEPERSVSSPDGLTWEFAADPRGNTIVLEVEPTRSGSLEGRLAVGDDTALVFRQFVYP